MQIKVSPRTFFVFDLDDTLFQEIDFLKSAYVYISSDLSAFIDQDIYEEMWSRYKNKENVFEWIIHQYHSYVPNLDATWLLKRYREHIPGIKLGESTNTFLQTVNKLNIPMGLITDGRSITQRNKIKALGIEHYFQDIIISEEFGSEKPDERNYMYFENKYPGMHFYFFGDNTSKDFIVPTKLGWKTICIKNAGYHIHEQSFERGPIPGYIIAGFDEIELI